MADKGSTSAAACGRGGGSLWSAGYPHQTAVPTAVLAVSASTPRIVPRGILSCSKTVRGGASEQDGLLRGAFRSALLLL